ncbi:MAG: hypothetical protein ACRDSE_02180 [Pseudonocardiaceae bacterium]
MPPLRQLIDAVSEYQVGAAAPARIRAIEALPAEPVHGLPEAAGADGRPAAVLRTGR